MQKPDIYKLNRRNMIVSFDPDFDKTKVDRMINIAAKAQRGKIIVYTCREILERWNVH